MGSGWCHLNTQLSLTFSQMFSFYLTLEMYFIKVVFYRIILKTVFLFYRDILLFNDRLITEI